MYSATVGVTAMGRTNYSKLSSKWTPSGIGKVSVSRIWNYSHKKKGEKGKRLIENGVCK